MMEKDMGDCTGFFISFMITVYHPNSFIMAHQLNYHVCQLEAVRSYSFYCLFNITLHFKSMIFINSRISKNTLETINRSQTKINGRSDLGSRRCGGDNICHLLPSHGPICHGEFNYRIYAVSTQSAECQGQYLLKKATKAWLHITFFFVCNCVGCDQVTQKSTETTTTSPQLRFTLCAIFFFFYCSLPFPALATWCQN